MECSFRELFCHVFRAVSSPSRLGQQIDDADVEVTLAKPVDKEHYRQQRAVAKLMQMAQNYHNYSVMPEMPTAPYSFTGQYPGGAGMVYPPTYGSRYGVGTSFTRKPSQNSCVRGLSC